MARKTTEKADTLTLEPDGNGYRLFGYIKGEQIRRKGTDLVKLEKLKMDLERGAQRAKVNEADRHILPPSWIEPEQLRDCEAGIQLLGDAKLTVAQCVQFALKRMATGLPVPLAEAQGRYLESLKKREVSKVHLENSANRLNAFFKAHPVAMVGEINNTAIEAYCLRPGYAGYSKLNDATVIRSFLNFCVERNILKESPFKLDMEDMKKRADKTRKRPKLLSPEQCEDLLKAAIAIGGGNHVPYLILCLWGCIRRAEVERLTVNNIHFGVEKSFVRLSADIAKTASYRKVYLPPNIVPLLHECVQAGLLDENPIGPPIERTWLYIRERAGLLTYTIDKWRNRRVDKDVEWQGNILRHTGVSYYNQMTGDINETARQAGHSREISYRHYIDLPEEGDAQKFYAITASLTSPTAEAKVA